MKRRSFLGGLLGAFVAAPAVAKVAEKALEQESAIDTHTENANKFFQKPYDYKVVSVSEEVNVYLNGSSVHPEEYKVVGDKVILLEPLRFSKEGDKVQVDIFYSYKETSEQGVSCRFTTSTLTLTYDKGPTPITVQSLPFSRKTSSAETYYLSGALPNPWSQSADT